MLFETKLLLKKVHISIKRVPLSQQKTSNQIIKTLRIKRTTILRPFRQKLHYLNVAHYQKIAYQIFKQALNKKTTIISCHERNIHQLRQLKFHKPQNTRSKCPRFSYHKNKPPQISTAHLEEPNKTIVAQAQYQMLPK